MGERVACLHADVSDYCRLIAADVHSTVRTLTAYRAVMTRLVQRHRGRVVDTAGDSLLATFACVSDATRCAVSIQNELERHNAGLPAHRRMRFRVGIDLGEVIVVDGRIYGDCVNVAARVQQIAPAGSIYLAGSAYDEIDAAVPLHLEALGERSFRNIDSPRRLYQVSVDGPGERG
jgi:adenylate cyclase